MPGHVVEKFIQKVADEPGSGDRLRAIALAMARFAGMDEATQDLLDQPDDALRALTGKADLTAARADIAARGPQAYLTGIEKPLRDVCRVALAKPSEVHGAVRQLANTLLVGLFADGKEDPNVTLARMLGACEAAAAPPRKTRAKAAAG